MLLIHRFDHPRLATLGRSTDGRHFEDVAEHPDATTVPGLLIYRLEAPLVFANADVVADDIRARVEATQPRCRAVVLDFEAVYEIDTEGADVLARLRQELIGGGIEVVLARAHAAVLDYLRRDGSLAKLGESSVYGSVEEAVERVGLRSVTMSEMDLSPDTVLQLAPGIRTRWDAAGHVLVDSTVGTIVDIGPGGFGILSLFSRPLTLGDAIDRLEPEHRQLDRPRADDERHQHAHRGERADHARRRPSSDQRLGRPGGARAHAPRRAPDR